jgi:hypothetical protein
MVYHTKARALTRAASTVIHHKGPPRPTFTKDSQNVVAVAALLKTLPAPSADMVDKVYAQLRDTPGVAHAQ